MTSMKEFLDEVEFEGIDYIIVELDNKSKVLAIITEGGIWKNSGVKDFKVRLDRPTDSTQKTHVHIARNKYLKNKNQQVSWNDDTTRHDKKTFNVKMGDRVLVQKIAKKALGLEADAILESAFFGEVEVICENKFVESNEVPRPAVLEIREKTA